MDETLELSRAHERISRTLAGFAARVDQCEFKVKQFVDERESRSDELARLLKTARHELVQLTASTQEAPNKRTPGREMSTAVADLDATLLGERARLEAHKSKKAVAQHDAMRSADAMPAKQDHVLAVDAGAEAMLLGEEEDLMTRWFFLPAVRAFDGVRTAMPLMHQKSCDQS
jgi:SHS2 domain-containing protein